MESMDIGHIVSNGTSATTTSGTSSNASKKSGGEDRYDKFHKIDKARKKLLHTQACDGTWHLLLSMAPSVLPVVIYSIDFGISLLIYILGRVLTLCDVFYPVSLGQFRGLPTMGFVLAFMLNFYVNTSITRLFATNKDAMKLISHINNVAVLLRGYLFDTPEKQMMTHRCLDYLCASHVHAYIGFSDVYTAENLWEGFNEEFGVLTEEENRFIQVHRAVGGSRYRECIVWCMEELHAAVKQGYIPPPIASGINAQVTAFEDAVQSLFDFRYLPIPFVSEHLLVFFIHIYLPIQTFEMAVQCEVLRRKTDDAAARFVIEVFGLILALLANMGFQGLFAVGAFLEQPYGPKTCHARVSTFCRLSVRETRKTLSAGSPRTDEKPLASVKAERKRLENQLISAGVIRTSEQLGIRALYDLVARHCQDDELPAELSAVV